MTGYPKSIPEGTPLYQPNCGVISTAMICGMSYRDAWDALKKFQSRPNSWKGRTYDHHRRQVIRDAGITYTTLTIPKAMTLRSWLKTDQYHRSETYEMCTTGHAMLLHRGRLFDQNAGKNGVLTFESPELKRRVKAVIRIDNGPLREALNLS